MFRRKVGSGGQIARFLPVDFLFQPGFFGAGVYPIFTTADEPGMMLVNWTIAASALLRPCVVMIICSYQILQVSETEWGDRETEV